MYSEKLKGFIAANMPGEKTISINDLRDFITEITGEKLVIGCRFGEPAILHRDGDRDKYLVFKSEIVRIGYYSYVYVDRIEYGAHWNNYTSCCGLNIIEEIYNTIVVPTPEPVVKLPIPSWITSGHCDCGYSNVAQIEMFKSERKNLISEFIKELEAIDE